MTDKWLKPALTLAVTGLLAWFSPTASFDPWNLLNPKKIATMIFALVFIHAFGSAMNRLLGNRTGTILTGFCGGLVSSTATTMSLARKSKFKSAPDSTIEMLIFLSATGAMLFEAVALVWTGTSHPHFLLLIVFGGPIATTALMIFFYSRKPSARGHETEDTPFKILPILKLSIFIVFILLLSKLLETFFGQNGLIILTFLVSLFEIHGSVIANVQLHENGIVGLPLLSSLLTISLAASYISKLFLISIFGSGRLRSLAFKSTLFLFLSLFISWLISLSPGFI
jgi:uncharacterized membrane protein (DUF4010 family)